VETINEIISTTSRNDTRRNELKDVAATITSATQNIKDVHLNLITIRRELERDDYHYITLNDAIALCNDAIDKLETCNG